MCAWGGGTGWGECVCGGDRWVGGWVSDDETNQKKKKKQQYEDGAGMVDGGTSGFR